MSYTPEEVIRAANAVDSVLDDHRSEYRVPQDAADATDMLRAYAATLRQPSADSGRVGDDVRKLLEDMAQYAPADGALVAPTAAMGFGIRAKRILAALAAQGQGEVACHRFVGPTGEVVTEWGDGLPDNGKRFPDLCPPVSSVQYAYFHPAPAASPAVSPVDDRKTQWRIAYLENGQWSKLPDGLYRVKHESLGSTVLTRVGEPAGVLAGWRIHFATGTAPRNGDRWEVYDPSGSGGVVNLDYVKEHIVRRLLDALAAPSAPEGDGGAG